MRGMGGRYHLAERNRSKESVNAGNLPPAHPTWCTHIVDSHSAWRNVTRQDCGW